MFDRFTSRSLRVLFYARYEVGRLGSRAVEPEHILLGVLDEGNGLAGRILARTGSTADEFRSDIVGPFTIGDNVSDSEEVPFSASCQRVLQYAAEEADRLLHESIGSEHLLLGLLREERSRAAEVLGARGLTIEAVRQGIVDLLESGEHLEPPGPPATPANTYQWPDIPFVPSRTVHILYSGMRSPEFPVINHPGPVFSAYGFTLKDIIVRGWDGNRWHIDIAPGLSDDTRFDFLMVLPQPEPAGTCLRLLQSAVEQHFGVDVRFERRMRDVFVLTTTGVRGSMLRRYPDPEPGTGFALPAFSAFTERSPDAAMFPLDPFSVHSVPFFVVVSWLEEILGGQVIDETALAGIYGFQLKTRVNTPDAFIQLLGDEAGLVIERQGREVPTLIVQRRDADADGI